jgi:hypothetical protein
MELQPIGLAQNQPQALHDGDPVPLTVPGQGGYVLYVGARARNLQACGATERALLFDPDTGQALTNLDQRALDFTEEADGYFQPAAAALQFDLPNVPACPDALGKGVAGRTARLEVTVTDAQGNSGKASVLVVPTCPSGDARCACICGPNYKPGGC